MKAPNITSLIAMLVLVLPAVSFAITQQFPLEQYWWAALAAGVIGAIVKALEVWLGGRQPSSAASFEAPAEVAQPVSFTRALFTK